MYTRHSRCLWQVVFEKNIRELPGFLIENRRYGKHTVDGDTARFIWTPSEFAQAYQTDNIDIPASRLESVFADSPGALLGFLRFLPGVVPTDAPWYFDLAVTSDGQVCGDIEQYLYSVEAAPDASTVRDCNRVWDPDGSVHGNPRSYGRYEGANISVSVMLIDRGDNRSNQVNTQEYCDSPQASAPTPTRPLPGPNSRATIHVHVCHRWKRTLGERPLRTYRRPGTYHMAIPGLTAWFKGTCSLATGSPGSYLEIKLWILGARAPGSPACAVTRSHSNPLL